MMNPTPYCEARHAIRSALEAAGVEFIPENGGGAGVRLRKSAALDARAQPGHIASAPKEEEP